MAMIASAPETRNNLMFLGAPAFFAIAFKAVGQRLERLS
jgi:hypothetical protein